jgi:ADP-sugar diphosphatase
MVLQAEIVGTSQQGSTTFYTVKVNESTQVNSIQWTVSKRYRQFHQLDQELSRMSRLRREQLPSKGFFGLRHRLNVGDFNTLRQQGLEQYLNALCQQICSLSQDPILRAFLQNCASVEEAQPEQNAAPDRDASCKEAKIDVRSDGFRHIATPTRKAASWPCEIQNDPVCATQGSSTVEEIVYFYQVRSEHLEHMQEFDACLANPQNLTWKREELRRRPIRRVPFVGSSQDGSRHAQPDTRTLRHGRHVGVYVDEWYWLDGDFRRGHLTQWRRFHQDDEKLLNAALEKAGKVGQIVTEIGPPAQRYTVCMATVSDAVTLQNDEALSAGIAKGRKGDQAIAGFALEFWSLPLKEASIRIGRHIVKVTAEGDLVGPKLVEVIDAKIFQDWASSIAREDHIALSKIHIQSLDIFREKVGFIKIKVDATKDGKPVPGIVFLRGGAPAILVVLKHENKKHTLVVRQARLPICISSLIEIPSVMLDCQGNFAGTAPKELQEETGIQNREDDLVNMTKLAQGEMHPGVYASCGGSDEFNPIFLYEKTISAEELANLNGRFTGVARDGKISKLQILPLDQLWRESPDSKALSALCLYDRLVACGRIPGV